MCSTVLTAVVSDFSLKDRHAQYIRDKAVFCSADTSGMIPYFSLNES